MKPFYELIPNTDGSVTILFLSEPERILRGLFPADPDHPEKLEDDLMERYEKYWEEAEVIQWPY